MDKVKVKVWVAVHDDMEFSEHDSLEAAIAVNPFVFFLEEVGTWNNGVYENYAYDVKFYNKEGLLLDGVSINSWKISNLLVSHKGFYYSYARNNIAMTVTDPWGTSVGRDFGNGRIGITSALSFLRAASKYYSWAEFRQADPEQKERSAIHLLEQKIEELKAENERMKAKLEAIREILTIEATEVE